jgi:hypothetical protein
MVYLNFFQKKFFSLCLDFREVRLKKLEQRNRNPRHNIGNCTTEEAGITEHWRRQLLEKNEKEKKNYKK